PACCTRPSPTRSTGITGETWLAHIFSLCCGSCLPRSCSGAGVGSDVGLIHPNYRRFPDAIVRTKVQFGLLCRIQIDLTLIQFYHLPQTSQSSLILRSPGDLSESMVPVLLQSRFVEVQTHV